LSNIEPFTAQLQSHFDDMFNNGREITLTIKKWDNWDINLENEVAGEEIISHIYKWLQKNTVRGKFNMSSVSENKVLFEQVRIPIYDAYNNSLDAYMFGKGLRKYLKATPFNFEVKLMTRGLGDAILVLGEK
jgi:hypothetical protein